MTVKNPLPRSTPESQGIASSAISKFVEAAEAQLRDLHSFMLVRHGQVVAEGWWSPYAAERPHMLFSLSKSFTSSAVGLAVAEGRLSLDDFVTQFFPDDLPAEISPNLAAMRVRHLLSMSTGHADDTMPVMFADPDGNFIRAFLAHPVQYEPGTHFLYNTGATYMLAAIVQKLTGQLLLDYLQPRLLDPLGIEGATWEISPQGVHMGGFGLSVKTEDIAKFGQLYLQKGVYDGQRILSEAWIEQASSKHISNGDDPKSDWAQGYGFQFWRCRNNAYRGDGAFGQYCIVMPEQDAVLAMTSGLGDMQVPLNLVWDILLPAMSAAPLPGNPAALATLTGKLATLKYDPPQGVTTSPTAAAVTGCLHNVSANDLGIEAVTLTFEEASGAFNVRTAQGEATIPFGYGDWREGHTPLFFAADTPTVASGVWATPDNFVLTIRFFEKPFVQTLEFWFGDDWLKIHGAMNVSFGSSEFTLKAVPVAQEA